MKKILISVTLVAAMLLTFTGYSQEGNNSEKRIVGDQKELQKLRTDLNTRTSLTKDQTVEWWGSEYGYSAMYNVDNTNYMASYDKKGNYIETYKKKDWSDPAVSSAIRSSWTASPYNNQEITGYWEVSDPNRKGYYFEVKDQKGKKSNVWADDKGKFYDKPYEQKVKAPNGEE